MKRKVKNFMLIAIIGGFLVCPFTGLAAWDGG
jgi:hypothetical protein